MNANVEPSEPLKIQKQKLQAVISGVGPDKPGIVAAMTRILLAHEANIEDSTMTRLAHEFALIMIVTLSEDSPLESLEDDLYELEKEMGMSFNIKPLDSHPSHAVLGTPCMISIGGQDRTGITHRVTSQLAALNINITDLNAHVIEGNEGATYIMLIEAIVPTPITVSELETKLRQASELQGLDISVNPLEDVAL